MARRETFPVLETRRLVLRRIEPRDAGGLHACLGDPECMRLWNMPPSRSKADTERTLTWLAKATSPYEHLAWAVAKRGSDRCVGMVSYHHREARNRRLEIGYVIVPQHQRKGLAGEAVGALIDHCVSQLHVHRIEALIAPENTPSIRLVERLGFRCEGGPLADYWCVGDRYLSVMMYARLAGGAH